MTLAVNAEAGQYRKYSAIYNNKTRNQLLSVKLFYEKNNNQLCNKTSFTMWIIYLTLQRMAKDKTITFRERDFKLSLDDIILRRQISNK